MGTTGWTRWVAIGVVVLLAIGGSLAGVLGLVGSGGSDARTDPEAGAGGGPRTTVVLPRNPLGWRAVEDAGTRAARQKAEAFGQGFGAQTVYAEYAGEGRSFDVTGIIPGGATDLGQALAASPDGAAARQFVNAGLGEGSSFPSGVDGVALRCGEIQVGQVACIWADSSVLTLMSWRLGKGVTVDEVAQLTAALVPKFRQPA